MIRKCDICGLEAEEHWMFSYNTGSKRIWLCGDCWKKGQYEVGKSEMHRRQKRYMIAKEKGMIK